MADTDRRVRPGGWRSVVRRLRASLSPMAYERAPDYGPTETGWSAGAAGPSSREVWLRQLARTRDLLEQAREVVVAGGWTGGGTWYSVRNPDGSIRAASLAESFALRAPGAPVAGACLVGILIRLAEDPDRVPTVDDVWRATDELHEAVHESLGHDSFPPGRCYSLVQRRSRLQDLTAWNDEPGRTAGDVLAVLDRAISRTIVGAVA